jgi:hypothetical protein
VGLVGWLWNGDAAFFSSSPEIDRCREKNVGTSDIEGIFVGRGSGLSSAGARLPDYYRSEYPTIRRECRGDGS